MERRKIEQLLLVLGVLTEVEMKLRHLNDVQKVEAWLEREKEKIIGELEELAREAIPLR